MSMNTEQAPFRPIQPIGFAAIAPVIRLRIYRFALAYRRSRVFWWRLETWALTLLTHPLAWTLMALAASSIGLYRDLR
jgi:hypothetical protein